MDRESYIIDERCWDLRLNKARKRFKVKKTKLDPSLITAVVADRADDRRIGARALARAPRLNKKRHLMSRKEWFFH